MYKIISLIAKPRFKSLQKSSVFSSNLREGEILACVHPFTLKSVGCFHLGDKTVLLEIRDSNMSKISWKIKQNVSV